MADVLDQSYTNDDNNWVLRAASGANEELGVEFVPTINAKLSQVIFKLYENGTVASCNVFVKLYSDSGGLPGTLMATSDSLDPSAWGSTPGEKTFTFSGANKVNIYKGRTYHLAVGGDYTASDTNYVGFRNDVSGSYTPSGTETYNGVSWSDPEATTDPYFKEYYDNTTIFTEGGNPMFFGGGLTLG
jgi:hypothetical protein